MSDHSNLMPRKMLFAIAALLGFTLVLVTAARVTGLGVTHVPPEPVVEALDLRFEERADGALLVRTVADGAVIKVLDPGSNQFIRGILRVQKRDRRAHTVSLDQPYQVARLADGRLTLRDLGTGRVLELRSFGPTNEGAFDALMNAGGSAVAHVPTPVTAAQNPPPR